MSFRNRNGQFQREPNFITCNSCQLVRINGVVCHETGCPESWRDPVTGKGYPVPCFQCGCDFEPEERPSRYSWCPDCQGYEEGEERYQLDEDEEDA